MGKEDRSGVPRSEEPSFGALAIAMERRAFVVFTNNVLLLFYASLVSKPLSHTYNLANTEKWGVSFAQRIFCGIKFDVRVSELL